jgi:hypothetical protein
LRCVDVVLKSSFVRQIFSKTNVCRWCSRFEIVIVFKYMIFVNVSFCDCVINVDDSFDICVVFEKPDLFIFLDIISFLSVFIRLKFVDSLRVFKCKMSLAFQISFSLFSSFLRILHWNDQTKCLFEQLTHFLLFVVIVHVTLLCASTHKAHFLLYLYILLIWSYRWQLKHCINLQIFSNNSHVICVYSWSQPSLIKRLTVSKLYTSIINNENNLIWFIAFLNHVMRVICK